MRKFKSKGPFVHNFTQGDDTRADAAIALYNILELGKSARECLPQAQYGHTEQDKAWIQEMVYGVLRQLPRLQRWLRMLLEKPLKNRYKVLEHLIMLGFYQLAYSRVSTHAAVSETVSATQSLQSDSLKGLVNAILRNFIREELDQQEIDDPQIQSGMPKWLYKKVLQAYPDSLDELAEQMQQRPPIWLRVNRVKTSPKLFMQALTDNEVGFSTSEEHPEGVILEQSQNITVLPGFAQGWFAVQDGAAQLAARYLDPQPGDRVLDCCAAPGGKTCHIIERQPKLEACIALDIDEGRLQRVEENLERLDHQAELLAADALKTAHWWDGQLFDRILLDAPCSATGVIRRHPDIKWLRKGADIAVLAELQYEILQAMWDILKPGGTLLYATCSILPEENAEQITRFMADNQNASLLPLTPDDCKESPGRQILPGEKQMDGFYYARLLKS